MSESRLQHYVPQFYLKYFADPEGLLHTYDRLEKRYLALSPKTICAEKDLYTIRDDEGKRDTLVEELLANAIEGPAKPAFEKLRIERPLDFDELRGLALFVSVQQVRVPAHHQQLEKMLTAFAVQATRSMFATQERVRALQDEMRSKTGRDFKIDPQELVNFAAGNAWKVKPNRSFILAAMLTEAIHMAPIIKDLNWESLVAGRGRAFVTSDNPLTIVTPRSSAPNQVVGVLTPGAIKYIPLTSRVCLRLGSPGDRISWRGVDAAVVRVINANIASNSERFVLACQAEILKRSVAMSRIETIDPDDRVVLDTIDLPDGSQRLLSLHFVRTGFYHDSM